MLHSRPFYGFDLFVKELSRGMLKKKERRCSP